MQCQNYSKRVANVDIYMFWPSYVFFIYLMSSSNFLQVVYCMDKQMCMNDCICGHAHVQIAPVTAY